MPYFLIFPPDRGDRESCSVYYTSLVIAKDMDEAKNKFIKDRLIKDRYLQNRFARHNHMSLGDIDDIIYDPNSPAIKGLISNSSIFVKNDEDEDGIYDILEIKPIE
jgi:hypothetical protein